MRIHKEVCFDLEYQIIKDAVDLMAVKNTEPADVNSSQELRDRFAGGNKGEKLASTSVM